MRLLASFCFKKRPNMDVAQYSIKPSLPRELFPSFIKLVLLSVAFFVGIIINLRLLNIKPPMQIVLLIVVLLVVLSAVQVLLTHMNLTKIQYNFFIDHIEKEGKNPSRVYYNQVQGIEFKRSFFDKMFGTGTIVLLPDFRIDKVGNAKQVFYYVQQLVQRAGGVSGLQVQQQYQQPQQQAQQNYPRQ